MPLTISPVRAGVIEIFHFILIFRVGKSSFTRVLF